MRLEPSEEAMYRRMDLKDHLLIVILIMGFIASLSFFLLANPNSQVIGLGAIISSLAGILGFGISQWRRFPLVETTDYAADWLLFGDTK